MSLGRRNFIKLAASSALVLSSCGTVFNQNNNSNNSNMIIKPKRLRKNAKIGIVAPATNVPNPDDIAKAIEVLNYFELNYELAASIQSGSGYRTRIPSQRAEDFNKMFYDDSIDAVFCIRGGYGSAQILDLIDYENIKKHPKIFLGYSDITAVHNSIFRNTGLITFHGPVLMSSFPDYTTNAFQNIFFNEIINSKLENPREMNGIRSKYPVRVINAGNADGRLLGGNISLVASLIGTKYQPNYRDSILFLEEVGETPYRIDRMLNQIKMAGLFEGVKGIVIGKCEDCEIGSSNSTWDLSLGEVIDYYIKPLNVPSFYGLMIGHTKEQLTLPHGCLCSINTEDCTINLLESPFS